MNWWVKGVRVLKVLYRHKLLALFLCYILSLCYVLDGQEQNITSTGTHYLYIFDGVGQNGRNSVRNKRLGNKLLGSSRIQELLTLKKHDGTNDSTVGQNAQNEHKFQHTHTNASKLLFKPANRKGNNFTMYKDKHETRLRTQTYTKDGPPVGLFQEWLDFGEFHCENESEMEAFPKFMRIKDVVIDRQKGSAPSGGERVTDVLNQKEATEFVKMQPGFFEISCQDPTPLFFWGNHHMQNWFINIGNTPRGLLRPVHRTAPEFTLAVVRIEYANLYHLVADLYSAFLMMEFFEKSQAETNVILIEAHPWTPLDLVWQQFFNSTVRLSALPQRTFYKELVWCIGGHDNPMSDFMDPELPLVEEFRDLVLTTYQIDPNSHVLNCKHISILLLWRHNYLAHARNPRGVIKRKFANEKEILKTIKDNFPNATVKDVRIELFNMSTQLNLVAKTDILLGMLGAGLTHAMFLPKSSGLIELRPRYYRETSRHFESITTWRRLKYIRWSNRDPKNEFRDYKTHIPQDVVVRTISDMMNKICPS